MSVKCETKFGQNLCVVGSIPELGSWKIFNEMKWSEGHIWVLDKPIVTKALFLTYKYVLFEKG